MFGDEQIPDDHRKLPEWSVLGEFELGDLILELFGEAETGKIIPVLLENEYTIPQILKESKVPKTSGYGKIENLILDVLIIESGKVTSESEKYQNYNVFLKR